MADEKELTKTDGYQTSAPVICSTANPASDSSDEIFQKLVAFKVICGDCKKKVNLNYCYRCYDCNYWFCKDCAKIHFKRYND